VSAKQNLSISIHTVQTIKKRYVAFWLNKHSKSTCAKSMPTRTLYQSHLVVFSNNTGILDRLTTSIAHANPNQTCGINLSLIFLKKN
jgi:hypothetical protein